MKKTDRAATHVERHRDGSVRARGRMRDGVPTGYWEWFRVDGTRLRSGHFENGAQVGEWTTYDREGRVYKVTVMKPPSASRKKARTSTSRRAGNPRCKEET